MSVGIERKTVRPMLVVCKDGRRERLTLSDCSVEYSVARRIIGVGHGELEHGQRATTKTIVVLVPALDLQQRRRAPDQSEVPVRTM